MRRGWVLLTVCIVLSWIAPISHAAGLDGDSCGSSVTAGATSGGFFGNSTGHCDGSGAAQTSSGSASPPPPTMVVDCGVSPSKSSLPECKRTGVDCTAQAAASPPGTVVTAIITYDKVNGGLQQAGAGCVSRGLVAPGLSEADVRAEVVKRVPTAAVAAAPSGSALVQLESLFWVDTAKTRDLGTAVLAGHQVAITATVSTVGWDFGDGATDSSNGPGRPFTKDSHCGQKQCPDWFGHTYTKTGKVTVTARVRWSATYSVDGGPAQPISGTVTGPPATMSILVKQARAVLVPNPTK
jgi:hypothetical protein